MQNYNTNNDFEVSNGPSDSISDMCFCPSSDFLAVASWDSQVRIWEIQCNTQALASSQAFNAVPKAQITHEAPVLAVDFTRDGRVFSGSCDTTVKMLNLGTPGAQPMQVAKHDAPVKTVKYIEEKQILMTGSWDKTLRYWDLRSPSPVATVTLPERLWACSFAVNYAVIGVANNPIHIFDIRQNPTVPFKRFTSNLKHQIRCIANFHDNTGFAVGSIEGRVAIQYFEDITIGADGVGTSNANSRNFTFKCHRDQSNNVYSVNSIAFHPTYGTFATAGGDGTYHFWDKDVKQRLKQFTSVNSPISSACFNHNGSIYAYGISYDWSKGHEHYNPQQQPPHLMLHLAKDEEIKKRPATKKR